MESYQGLILAQRSAGEKGKFIDVLTEQQTVQEIYVRGAKKPTASGTSATQQFAYAVFSVSHRNNRLYLDSVEPIRIFYHLRESLTRLSLATYFSELVRLSVREFQSPDEHCQAFRLTLNTLHYLESGIRAESYLKPTFELRLMTELGMMPDLIMCRNCGAYLPEQLYFSPQEGYFYCAACHAASPLIAPILLQKSALQAMRHIVFADFDRLFSWKLGEQNLADVRSSAERFVRYHLGLHIPALDFYHDIANRKEGQHEPE